VREKTGKGLSKRVCIIYEWLGRNNINYYLSALLMNSKRKPYNFFQLSSATFMILALLWLTVSAPFVFASQQQVAKGNKQMAASVPVSDNEEEASNTFSNTTEEKNHNNSSSSFSEEYLHDHHISDYFFSVASQYHNCENADTYIAFHGELLVPPPNVA
jgi:hypothetical protein